MYRFVRVLYWICRVRITGVGVEAAGIEPASESLQLQPLHMLFRGQISHPPNFPGRARGVLAWFKFHLLLLQAWEKEGYPTS